MSIVKIATYVSYPPDFYQKILLVISIWIIKTAYQKTYTGNKCMKIDIYNIVRQSLQVLIRHLYVTSCTIS